MFFHAISMLLTSFDFPKIWVWNTLRCSRSAGLNRFWFYPEEVSWRLSMIQKCCIRHGSRAQRISIVNFPSHPTFFPHFFHLNTLETTRNRWFNSQQFFVVFPCFSRWTEGELRTLERLEAAPHGFLHLVGNRCRSLRGIFRWGLYQASMGHHGTHGTGRGAWWIFSGQKS